MQVAMDQFQRQAQEKDTTVNRQQAELQTLRVWIMHTDILICNSTLLHASLECSNSIPCYMLHWCTTLLQTLNLRIHTLIGLTVFLLDFNKTPWLDGASVINGLTESRNCSCVIIF